MAVPLADSECPATATVVDPILELAWLGHLTLLPRIAFLVDTGRLGCQGHKRGGRLNPRRLRIVPVALVFLARSTACFLVFGHDAARDAQVEGGHDAFGFRKGAYSRRPKAGHRDRAQYVGAVETQQKESGPKGFPRGRKAMKASKECKTDEKYDKKDAKAEGKGRKKIRKSGRGSGRR
ncbi:MAG: hypothetical protein HQL37_11400 [Alphaproteobacteria bacterium]|nr:hypothetical protein [Alphaproteobacteria bacterium]